MFKDIPQTRLIIYGLILGLLPFLLVYLFYVSQKDDLNNLRQQIDSLESLALQREQRQAVNMALRYHFKTADHFYIDKHIETIHLLEPEVESLQKLVASPQFTEDESIKKRLEFLTGQGNRIHFSEGVVQSTPVFQETTETLVHPVEVNVNDLQNILSMIEGVDIGHYKPAPGRPQLIILDFKLDKRNTLEKNEVYQLNLKLLKREYL